MNNTISDDRIENFRNLINSNSEFVYKIYSAKNDKNYWNVICSCMDWLSVSIKYLKNVKKLDSDIDVKVMQMFSLISAIDIVFECITQLHRIFIDIKTLPFAGEKIAFSQRIFDEDDNNYFKSIRASFGAHPVNLNQSNSKRFASWPFDSHINSGQIMVRLYSNKVGEDDLEMSLDYNELLSFFHKRYAHLDLISQKVKELYDNFKKYLACEIIDYKNNSLEQLYVLKMESAKRLNNEYYNGVINDLIMIYEAELKDSELQRIASEYKKLLNVLIEEIMNNLQNMNLIDLEYEKFLEDRKENKKMLTYEANKFYNWIHGDQDDPLINCYLKKFNETTENKYNFDINDSKLELFLKFKLMLSYQKI